MKSPLKERLKYYSLCIFGGVILLLNLFFTNISKPVFAVEQTYDETSVIVKFKEGESEGELKEKIERRMNARNNIAELFKKTQEDILSKLTGRPLPEERLKKLQQAVYNSGVLKSEEITAQGKREVKKSKLHVLELRSTTKVSDVIRNLKKLDMVEFVEPNYIIRSQEYITDGQGGLTNTPNDSFYEKQSNLWNVKAELAWEIESPNKIIVAVIDTGIFFNHEDIPKAPDIISGTSFVSATSEDDNGHGTHVSGIIGAIRNNEIGISGVSSNAIIMSIKALNSQNTGTLDDVIKGIEYASANNARVINLSLGARASCPASIQTAINNATNAGVTVVVASGNDNINIEGATGFFPANCNNVVAVGATTLENEKASYSNYGTQVDLWAPGGEIPANNNCGAIPAGSSEYPCILSTYKSMLSIINDYAYLAGTSMAAPHVAGAASMLLAKNQNLTPSQIESILVNTGDNIQITENSVPRTVKKLNILNALEAVNLTLTPSPTPTHTPTSTPTPTPTPIKKNITWTTTNPSSSQLEYGLTSSLGFATTEINTSPRVTNHSIELTNLISCTTYYYKTVSKEADNTVTNGSITSFVSDACPGNSAVLSTQTSTVGASSGGQVTLNQSDTRGVTLDFPANFISSGSVFTQIQRVEVDKVAQASPAPALYSLVDPYMYEFKALTSPTSNLTNFSQQITVTVRYTDAEMINYDPNSIVIARHNGITWQILPDCQRLSSPTRVSCRTQQFSSFALIAQSALTPTPLNTSTPTPTLSVSPTPKCDIYPDPKAPNIFQIDVTENKATLHVDPAGVPSSYYMAVYGFDSNVNMFGGRFSQGDSSGAVRFELKSLSPGTTYYVKVRGGNDCKTGDWSNIEKFTTEGGEVAGVNSSITQNSAQGVSSVQEVGVNSADALNQSKQPVTNIQSTVSNELPKAGGGMFQIGIATISMILIGIFF